MKQWCYEYPRPAVTVDAIILHRGKSEVSVILVKRKNDPFRDFWALPGGFVDENETLEQAVRREVMEELQIDLPETAFHQFRVYSDPQRDPRHRTITMTFLAWVDEQVQPSAADDASEAAWFSLKNLPALAFDHSIILDDVKKHLSSSHDISNNLID